MTEPFDACWRRVDRAETHRVAAAEVWNDFLKDHPYTFTLDYECEGTFILRVHQLRPTPPELAVLTGEWLYNLRCALDYTIWATAVYASGRLPPPGEGTLQYPIYDAPTTWHKNLHRLKPLAQHHRDMLEKMQPYNSKDVDANYLGWLNRLARIDRHRRLSVVTAYMAEMSPVFAYPEGCTATLQFGDRVLIDGEANIARIRLTPWMDHWEVQANPRVGIDPEIADWAVSPFWQRIPYNDRLKMIEVFVMGEVATYEYDCTGTGRKSYLIPDRFKVESDARRIPRQIIERHESRTEWSPPQPGKRSTRVQLEGRDFPPDGPGPVE